jgi:hypothetical protein
VNQTSGSSARFALARYVAARSDIVNGIMKRIIIQMDEHSLSQLDDAAREESESRAAFARRAIQAALAERRRRQELEQVVKSFRRRPPEDLTASKAAIRRAWPA